MKIKGKNCPNWTERFIAARAFSNVSIKEFAKSENITPKTVYNKLYEERWIQETIEKKKSEQAIVFKHELRLLISDAINVYKELIKKADRDSTRLKAAETILKEFKLIDETKKVELSGEVTMPTINIVSKKEE